MVTPSHQHLWRFSQRSLTTYHANVFHWQIPNECLWRICSVSTAHITYHRCNSVFVFNILHS
uniref:Ribosomal protein S25 n=1 Tax=Gasterosteus aculeatus TaxID=69293 RepID=G3NUN4_GASAC